MADTSITRHIRDFGILVREWRPGGTPKGAFLLLHGMESHSVWFSDIASRLAGAGWATIAFDRTGWGGSEGVRGHLASYRDFVEETAWLASRVGEKYGSVHLAGMSWGGMAGLYLALRRGWLFDSFAALAPGLFAKKSLSLSGKLKVALDFCRNAMTGQVAPVFRPEHFTNDPEWRRFIETDPLRVKTPTSAFFVETLKMRRFIAEHAGKRRLPPALCLLAGNDAIIENRRTADLCRAAGMAVSIVPDAAHTLIFEKPAEIAAALAAHAEKAAAKQAKKSASTWVVGGGAVGGAIASLLAFGGREVGVLVRENRIEELRRTRFTLRAGKAKRQTGRRLSVAADPRDLPANPRLVVLAVKSYDTTAALARLRGAIPPETVIASLQNGVMNEEAIRVAFPANTIVAGSICAGLELEGTGRVSWPDDRGGLGGALYFGNAELAKRVWLETLRTTGMETRWYEGENAAARLKWSKLMLNIGFNALNSITGLSSGEILNNAVFGRLAVRAMREGFAIMHRMSLKPLDFPDFPVSKVRYLLMLPVNGARRVMAWRATRNGEAAFSMRQDIVKNRQHTEFNDLNGKIIEIGTRLHLDVSANQALAEKFKSMP